MAYLVILASIPMYLAVQLPGGPRFNECLVHSIKTCSVHQRCLFETLSFSINRTIGRSINKCHNIHLTQHTGTVHIIVTRYHKVSNTFRPNNLNGIESLELYKQS